MTQTMRERLIAKAETEAALEIAWGDPVVTNWPDLIDAILAELREPDEAMREEAIISQFDFAEEGSAAVAVAFTAMIDAVRER